MSRITRSDLPVTPDGRYFVVKGRLWRMSNPNLDPALHQRLVNRLMQARRDIAAAHRARDTTAEREARARVNSAKIALGERGPVWWDEAEGDHNQRLAENTPYAGWFRRLATLH